MLAQLVHRDTIAEGTAAFTFELRDEGIAFQAGQSCDVTLLEGNHRDDKGMVRTLSLASSPRDLPRIMVATRLTGSAFKRNLMDCALGTEVQIDGPWGSFTLHHTAARPALCLAGGIGITPFRAMIKDATEQRLSHEIALFYSNRTAAGVAFLEDLNSWRAANPKLDVVATLTQGQPDRTEGYDVGRLDAGFLRRRLRMDVSNAVPYIAGPSGFVRAMRQALIEVGADADRIRAEEFPGYERAALRTLAETPSRT